MMGYDPEYCPLNKNKVPYREGTWFAVRTNKSCPANQALLEPRKTYAGWYDDAAQRLERRGAICFHGAAIAWFDGLMTALEQLDGPAPAHRVKRHLEVAAKLGFGQWTPLLDDPEITITPASTQTIFDHHLTPTISS